MDQEDIEDIKYVLNNKRISPVQFIRDRELGIRGTLERVAIHRVYIKNESIYPWPYHVRQEIYTMALNQCPNDEVAKKMLREYDTMYIKIPAGIGRCIKLLINNMVKVFLKNPKITNMLRTYDDFFNACNRYAYKDNENNDHFGRMMRTYVFILHEKECKKMHYEVQDSVRRCNSCRRVTCKCSVEECNVI